MLSRDAYKPLYKQFEETLKYKIENSEIKVGSKIPSERALTEEYGISRITVRKAIDALVAQGYLQRGQRKATVVISNKSLDETSVFLKSKALGIIEELHALGISPTITVIDRSFVPAPKQVRQRLMLPPLENDCFVYSRLFKDNLSPILYNKSYVSVEIGQLIKNLDFSMDVILSYLESQGYTIGFSKYKVSAIPADDNHCKLLRVSLGEPVIVIERTLFANPQTPLIWSRTYCRHDRYSFKVTLPR